MNAGPTIASIRGEGHEPAEGQPAGSWALRSFDVFDTLLTRVWLRPRDGFLLVAIACEQAGLPIGNAATWQRMRLAAEALVRRRIGEREVTLAEIYQRLAVELGWNAAQATQAMSIELECERRTSRPIEPMVQRVRALLADSRRVACISDFYAPRGFVHELLRQSGIALAEQDVFVSCDERLTKRSGRLFSLVAGRLQVPAALIRHTGDHPHSDLRQAQTAGFAAEHYTRSMPLPAELLLGTAGVGDEAREQLIVSAIGGAARRARLGRELTGREETLSNVATSVAGPLIFGYVLWLLMQTQERGIRRLYFLSRDGQILHRVAREVVNALRCEIDLCYLHASRRAWFLASNALEAARHRAAAITSDGSVAIADLLERLAIEPAQVRAALAAAGFPPECWSRTLTGPAVGSLRAVLEGPPFDNLVAERATQEHQLCVEYLGGQGVFDGIPSAIVDVGWKGRLQRSLARLLRSRGCPAMAGFYLALRERPAESEAGPMLTYLDDADGRTLNPTLTEAFCAADHGTVLGYQADGAGRAIPVLAQGHQPVLDWGVPLFQDGIVRFANKMLDAMTVLAEPPQRLTSMFRRTTLRAVRALVEEPSVAEATVLGSFPHDPGQLHTKTVQLAPAVSTGTLLGTLLRPSLLDDRRTHWQQASITRSTRLHPFVLPLWRARIGRGFRGIHGRI